MISNLFRDEVTVRVSGIITRDDAVLLIAHKKKDDIYWLLPGGGVRHGESLAEALRREFMEELGVAIAVGAPAFMCDSIDPLGKRHILNISFLCGHSGGEFRLGRERRLHDFGFFPKREISGMKIYPPVNATLESVMEGKDHDFYLGSLWLK
ncbi:MAG TPA: NUDIX hydrolase [Spirochaetota bacterium]|nr:NUDIX hydrolase [Spirochaetota bacterium]HPV41564.1 NUDIX hydrolase [Spirochaetota bacterium]